MSNDITRRDALALGVSAAALAVTGANAQTSAIKAADVPAPKFAIEKGASLRMLRPVRFVQADEQVAVDFASELLRPTLVTPATLADAVSEQFPGLAGVVPGLGSYDPNPWGLGFELKGAKSPHWTAPGGSPRTFGHFGGSGTFLWVDPDAEVACVVLTDREFGDWAPPLWSSLSADVLAAHAA